MQTSAEVSALDAGQKKRRVKEALVVGGAECQRIQRNEMLTCCKA